MTRSYATSSAYSTPLEGLSFVHLPDRRTALYGAAYTFGVRGQGKLLGERSGKKVYVMNH